MGQLTRDLGFPLLWVGDVQGIRVELWATDRAQFEAALQAAHQMLPEPVEMVVAYEPLGTALAEMNAVPGVARPWIRARTSEDLLTDLPGWLVVEDDGLGIVPSGEEAGYLIIWQPECFLNDP
jgi:hypothetical protein